MDTQQQRAVHARSVNRPRTAPDRPPPGGTASRGNASAWHLAVDGCPLVVRAASLGSPRETSAPGSPLLNNRVGAMLFFVGLLGSPTYKACWRGQGHLSRQPPPRARHLTRELAAGGRHALHLVVAQQVPPASSSPTAAASSTVPVEVRGERGDIPHQLPGDGERRGAAAGVPHAPRSRLRGESVAFSQERGCAGGGGCTGVQHRPAGVRGQRQAGVPAAQDARERAADGGLLAGAVARSMCGLCE
eukprot:ctg_110.g55